MGLVVHFACVKQFLCQALPTRLGRVKLSARHTFSRWRGFNQLIYNIYSILVDFVDLGPLHTPVPSSAVPRGLQFLHHRSSSVPQIMPMLRCNTKGPLEISMHTMYTRSCISERNVQSPPSKPVNRSEQPSHKNGSSGLSPSRPLLRTWPAQPYTRSRVPLARLPLISCLWYWCASFSLLLASEHPAKFRPFSLEMPASLVPGRVVYSFSVVFCGLTALHRYP